MTLDGSKTRLCAKDHASPSKGGAAWSEDLNVRCASKRNFHGINGIAARLSPNLCPIIVHLKFNIEVQFLGEV